MSYTRLIIPIAVCLCVPIWASTISGQFDIGYTETTESYVDGSVMEVPCLDTAVAPVDYGECPGSGPIGLGTSVSVDLGLMSGRVLGTIDTGELLLYEGSLGELTGRHSSAGFISGQFAVRGNYLISGNSGQVNLWNLLFAGASGFEGLTEILVEVDGGAVDAANPVPLSRGQVYDIALFGFVSTYGSLGNGSVNEIEYQFSDEVRPIPEPSTGGLVGLVLGGLVVGCGMASRLRSRELRPQMDTDSHS